MSSAPGLITDTIEFSSVDGPGNRFVVFLQGCNFDCIACHNPYTINVCNNCGDCLATCSSGALTFGDDGLVVWNEDACEGTDACLATCPWDATPKARPRQVEELLTDIRRAAPFLSGITVSGGEATQQADFVHALFSAVKADPALHRLTCFVDSNGAATRDTWTRLAPVMDGAMIDLKCLDPQTHRTMTGQPNDQVLETIRHLDALGKLYEVRLLLIPGVNDDPDLLRRTAEWLADLNPLLRLKLIGFRPCGVRPNERELVQPTAEQISLYRDVFASRAQFSVCSL